MYRYIITSSSYGYEIYCNLITSPAGHFLSRSPYVLGLLKEVLESTELKGNKISVEHNMGRVIGNSFIVETSTKDNVFYAKPYKKSVFSRYVKNREPLPSQVLTIILEKDDGGDWQLLDTWIGPCTPPFPGGENENIKSKTYWENHALIQDSQDVQSKTITKVCPY